MYETYYGFKCTEWLCHFKDGRVKCRKANYHVIDNQYYYWPADKRQICNSLMWIHIILFSGSYCEVYFFIHGLNLTREQPCRCWSWRIRRVTVCLDYLCVYIHTPVSGKSSHVGNRSRSKSARCRSGCVIPYGQCQSVVRTLGIIAGGGVALRLWGPRSILKKAVTGLYNYVQTSWREIPCQSLSSFHIFNFCDQAEQTNIRLQLGNITTRLPNVSTSNARTLS